MSDQSSGVVIVQRSEQDSDKPRVGFILIREMR